MNNLLIFFCVLGGIFMKKSISLYLIFAFLMTGMLEEFSNDEVFILSSKQASLQVSLVFLCLGLLLCYTIPFALGIKYISKRWQVTAKLLPLSFVCGYFIPGWIAGECNDATDQLLKHSGVLVTNIASSLETGVVEEMLKVLVVIWLLSLLGLRLKKHFMIAGMGVGLGFQFCEDIDYLAGFIDHHPLHALKYTLADRLSGCLVSHMIYSGVMAIGVYEIFYAHHYKRGIFYVLTAILSHALYDAIADYGALFIVLSGAFLLLIWYQSYQEIDQAVTTH